jgi:hypothetical protein
MKRLNRVSEGARTNLTQSLSLPVPEPLTENRIRRQAGRGGLRDLTACYVTVATQVLGMHKLDAIPLSTRNRQGCGRGAAYGSQEPQEP